MIELRSLETVRIVESGFQCIWKFDTVSSYCFYNPHNPPIYFSLGDALAAVGLLFAVIQLISPIKKMTLEIKGLNGKRLWLLIGSSLLSILIATNIPQLQYLGIPQPLNYALFWEVCGFIIFVVTIIWFWFKAGSHWNMFSNKNAEQFFDVILREVANEKDGHLEASINILDSNLEKIINALKAKGDDEANKYASALLDYVLSEKEVLKYIVTNRIDFLFRFLFLVKESGISRRELGFVVSKIIGDLYNNPESYLYRQLDDHRGVSLYAPIYEEIFKKDKSFIREFSPLREWRAYGVSEELLLNASFIDVYLKSIEEVIESDGFSDRQICDQLSSALYELETFVRRANWTSKDPDKWCGSQVGDFLGRTFPDLYRKAETDGTISNFEKQYTEGTRKYRQNISASYAQALVDYLGLLANHENRSMERHYALEATDRVLSIFKSESGFVNVRKYFFEFIWTQIEDNVKSGHFPPTLRIYLEIMLWNGSDMPHWRKAERKKLVEFLYSELAPRLEKNDLMADYKTPKRDILLPDYVKYEQNMFWYLERDGSKEELKA